MVDKEQLSALLDGELDELATVRLLRGLDADPRELAAWEQYSLIGDALRAVDGAGEAGCAGARRALAQIIAEPVPVAARQARPAWRRMAPWAVAASAAALAFLSGGGWSGSVAGVRDQVLALVGNGPVAAVDLPGEANDPMVRYIEYHRELAASGFEQTGLVTVAGGERSR